MVSDFLIGSAHAQSIGGGAGGAASLMQFLPLVAIFIIFYFLLIRPQQKRVSDHKAMVSNVKRGDTVVTGGGVIGKVVQVKEEEVEVEIAPNTRIKVVKSTLSDVRVKGEPANDIEKK